MMIIINEGKTLCHIPQVMLWNGKVFPFVEKYSLYKGKYILVRNILAGQKQ